MKTKTSLISREVVKEVGATLKHELTESQVEYIVNRYTDAEKEYPTHLWYEIIEILIDEAVGS